MDNEFLCEKRLEKLNPDLHRRYSNSVFSIQKILENFLKIFPYFTDHSVLHSMNVMKFCNNLIGDQVGGLNADELYILLMAVYLHDSGMGVSPKDYEEFLPRIDFGTYFRTHSAEDKQRIIRDFHNEFSGLFIRKYAPLFEIPSEEHTFAIIQVARGHRKTNLYDEKEYNAHYPLENGNTVCLPYLSALIRLADEVDIAADRNTRLLYDPSLLHTEIDIRMFKLHDSIREMTITPDAFVLKVAADAEQVSNDAIGLKKKMQETLDLCRDIVSKRTPYHITQKEIRFSGDSSFSF